MGNYVITGSASGIGAATRALVEADGHTVIGVDLLDAEIEADLSTADGRAGAVAAAVEQSGGVLDGLVTSAGVGPPFDPHKMLTINWFGTECFLSGLHDALVASESIAKVVAISSNSTTCGGPIPSSVVDACIAMDEAGAHTALDELGDMAMHIAYAGAKTAVARFVRRHAPTEQWAGSGIRLNAIAPGATLTPLLQGGLDDPQFGELIRAFTVPTGDFGTPDQIGSWVHHMLSPAADFMAGTLLFVDGGTDAMMNADRWPETS
ncbi:MAG: SDR family oxidoreductase [Acidimicrobiales bacterium]|nr:SDR family oxidoreductase [Acidimicrobiales bacterium]